MSVAYHNIKCCYDARNLIVTELRFICQVCNNECLKDGGWAWTPNNHYWDSEIVDKLTPIRSLRR